MSAVIKPQSVAVETEVVSLEQMFAEPSADAAAEALLAGEVRQLRLLVAELKETITRREAEIDVKVSLLQRSRQREALFRAMMYSSERLASED